MVPLKFFHIILTSMLYKQLRACTVIVLLLRDRERERERERERRERERERGREGGREGGREHMVPLKFFHIILTSMLYKQLRACTVIVLLLRDVK